MSKGADFEGMVPFLDSIVRIRGCAGSETLAGSLLCVSPEKRDPGRTGIRGKGILREMATLESRIDAIALISFDIYVQCRERCMNLRRMK